MVQPDDFTPPRRRVMNSDQTATIPDIFAYSKDEVLPMESTPVKLSGAGQLRFPGVWQELPDAANASRESIIYKCKGSLTALVTTGALPLDKRADALIKKLCADESRSFQDFELSGLVAALSSTRHPADYEIVAGSTECLCNKTVMVIQGYFSKNQMREALIVFPENNGYGYLALQSIRPEFPIYFDHLRHALKTVQWF